MIQINLVVTFHVLFVNLRLFLVLKSITHNNSSLVVANHRTYKWINESDLCRVNCFSNNLFVLYWIRVFNSVDLRTQLNVNTRKKSNNVVANIRFVWKYLFWINKKIIRYYKQQWLGDRDFTTWVLLKMTFYLSDCTL